MKKIITNNILIVGIILLIVQLIIGVKIEKNLAYTLGRNILGILGMFDVIYGIFICVSKDTNKGYNSKKENIIHINNYLKVLIIFLIIIILTFIITSIFIPLTNATKKCPDGYTYYKNNKCMKIYESKPKIIYSLKCDGNSIPEIRCDSEDYGYSNDGICYKIEIVETIK